MSTPTIMCLACPEPVEFKTEKEYKDHLLKIHGSTTTQGAMDIERAKKMNTPVTLPPGISEKDLPNKDFIDTLKRIEEKKPETPVISTPPPVSQPAPLILRYRFEGKCPSCGGIVDTIEIRMEDDIVAVAYCVSEKKQLEYKKLIPIEKQYEKRRDSVEQGEKRSSVFLGGMEEMEKSGNEEMVAKRTPRKKTINIRTSLQKENTRTSDETRKT